MRDVERSLGKNILKAHKCTQTIKCLQLSIMKLQKIKTLKILDNTKKKKPNQTNKVTLV